MILAIRLRSDFYLNKVLANNLGISIGGSLDLSMFLCSLKSIGRLVLKIDSIWNSDRPGVEFWPEPGREIHI